MALKVSPTGMGPKFTKTEREEVLLKVASMDRRGFNLYDIAREVHVSHSMASQYLKTLRERAIEAQGEQQRANMAVVKAQYDEIIREAWNQWERSKEDTSASDQTWEKPWRPDDPKTGKPMGRAADYKAMVLTKEVKRRGGRLGQPAYLTVITDCLDKLSKLWGLYPKEVTQVQATVASFNWDALGGMIPRDGQVPDRLEQVLALGVGMTLRQEANDEAVPGTSVLAGNRPGDQSEEADQVSDAGDA